VVKHFHAPDVVAGSLITVTAICATVSSPLWGMLSDRYGRRAALLGSQVFSFAGYLMLAWATDLSVLFASRIVEGFGGGNLGIASAYIADVTGEDERPRALAFGTAAFGAGFIVGPIASGGLAHFGFAVPFVLAAALQGACFALTATLLPESHAPARTQLRLRAVREAVTSPAVENALVRRFLYIFAFTSFFTTFSLYTNEVLHAGPEGSSLLLALAGAVGAATQILGVGPLVRRFGLQRTTLAAFAAGLFAYVLFGFVEGVALFAVAVVFWAFSGSVLRPSLDARIAHLAPEAQRGTLLGLGDALDNFSMICAPAIGAAVIGYNAHLAGVLPAVALGLGFYLTVRDQPSVSSVAS
jgi:DHA1 family tetracycline resistance protein-like MFS transporter